MIRHYRPPRPLSTLEQAELLALAAIRHPGKAAMVFLIFALCGAAYGVS